MSVPIQYYQEVRHIVTTPAGKQYVFEVQAQICLAYVEEEDVNYILSIKGGCCGQKRTGVYLHPNESTIRRWNNKGGS